MVNQPGFRWKFRLKLSEHSFAFGFVSWVSSFGGIYHKLVRIRKGWQFHEDDLEVSEEKNDKSGNCRSEQDIILFHQLNKNHLQVVSYNTTRLFLVHSSHI